MLSLKAENVLKLMKDENGLTFENEENLGSLQSVPYTIHHQVFWSSKNVSTDFTILFS